MCEIMSTYKKRDNMKKKVKKIISTENIDINFKKKYLIDKFQICCKIELILNTCMKWEGIKWNQVEKPDGGFSIMGISKARKSNVGF